MLSIRVCHYYCVCRMDGLRRTDHKLLCYSPTDRNLEEFERGVMLPTCSVKGHVL